MTRRRDRNCHLKRNLRRRPRLVPLLSWGLWSLAAASSVPEPAQQFIDVTAAAGLDFAHRRGATPEKYLVEIMGSGCAFLDYDGDGRLDIFLVNGGEVAKTVSVRHALYRNLGGGKFQDVTEPAGIKSFSAYGMGVAAGDYDNDGRTDLFLTYFGGPNQLYRNQGDGTFENVTSAAGVAGDGSWSSSAAFLDFNRDGRLDLYVCRYLDFAPQRNRLCGLAERGVRIYCSPRIYPGLPDQLFAANPDGTFRDVSREAGISQPGKSLGVVAADLDEDGWTDLYVANDTDPNYLFHNQGDGTFEEIGLLAGAALGETGEAQSGMGAAAADYDGDGRLDLLVSNLDAPQYTALYRNLGGLFFEDASSRAGVQLPSSRYVGFGLVFFDYDNDGDPDIGTANGHIDDQVHLVNPRSAFAQPKLILKNRGGYFGEIELSPALARPQVGRGLAAGDYDNDGDLDLLVSGCGEAPMLLRNESGNRNHWLSLLLQGGPSNRDAIGAVVTLPGLAGGRRFQRMGGGSYLSAGDPRLHIGLGAQTEVGEVEVRWPSSQVERFGPLEAGRRLILQEGTGKAAPPLQTEVETR